MSQLYTDPDRAYSLVLPDEWECASDSHSMAFYNPVAGVGALTVSTLRATEGVTANPELVIQNFVPKRVREGGNLQILRQSAFDQKVSIVYTEYSVDGDAWRVWVAAHSDQVVIAAYNCKLLSKGEEDDILDGIINSIRM